VLDSAPQPFKEKWRSLCISCSGVRVKRYANWHRHDNSSGSAAAESGDQHTGEPGQRFAGVCADGCAKRGGHKFGAIQ